MLRRLCESKPESHKKNVDIDIDTLACDTFWTKSCKGVENSIKHIPNENAQNILLGKNGLQCLGLYYALFVKREKCSFTAGSKVYVKQFLEKQGADYYSWLYFGNGSKALRYQLKEYKWCSYLGHGSFAHAHLLKKKKCTQKLFGAACNYDRTNKSFT